jgi:hypothetical protein
MALITGNEEMLEKTHAVFATLDLRTLGRKVMAAQSTAELLSLWPVDLGTTD